MRAGRGTRLVCIAALLAAGLVVTPGAMAKRPPPQPAGTSDLKLWGPWLWDESVMVGSAFSAQMTVENQGPDGATGVALTHTPPSGLEVTSASASEGSCSIGATVRCSLPDLAVGGQSQVAIGYRAISTGDRTLTMTTSARDADPNPSDNTGSTTVSVLDSTPMPISCDTREGLWDSDNDGPDSCSVPFTLGRPTAVRLSLSPTTVSAGEFIVVLDGPRRIEWRRQVASGLVVGDDERVENLEAGQWRLRLTIGDVVTDQHVTLPGGSTPGFGPVRLFCTPMGCSTLSVPSIQVGGTRHVHARSGEGDGVVTAAPA